MEGVFKLPVKKSKIIQEIVSFGWLIHFWDKLRTSLWFVPGITAVAVGLLASLTYLVDQLVSAEHLRKIPFLFVGQAETAIAILTTIAVSVLSIAGVVFSMTLVSLQLASTQFGPRLLRSFMRDRGNQVVLGIFVGTFLYCIALLPSVNADKASVFVPYVGVSLAVVLAALVIAMFIYFIDHVAQSIHADAVIRNVQAELITTIKNIMPERDDSSNLQTDHQDAEAQASKTDPLELKSSGSGYLRLINDTKIQSLLESQERLFIRCVAFPGKFIFKDEVIAYLYTDHSVDDTVIEQLDRSFVLGPHRTPLQDLSFMFQQLSEMAIRSLSPGINDPTTAMHCIDSIAYGFTRLLARNRPSSFWKCEGNGACYSKPPLCFENLLANSFEDIARCASVHFSVWLRIFESLSVIHSRAKLNEDLIAIENLTNSLLKRAKAQFSDELDLDRLRSSVPFRGGP